MDFWRIIILIKKIKSLFYYNIYLFFNTQIFSKILLNFIIFQKISKFDFLKVFKQ